MKLLSIGAVTPYGTTIAAHVKAKGIQPPHREFLNYTVHGKSRRIEVERALEPSTPLPVPDSVLRRMSRSTRMTLSAIEEAKKIYAVENKHSKVGLIVGTTHGPAQTSMDFMHRLVRFDFKGASPNLFAQSVHNNVASSVALTYGWQGPNLTLVQEDNLWTALMHTSETCLKNGSADLIWLIVGNETSLHLPYIDLFEACTLNPGLETLSPAAEQIASESFSCFLLGRDEMGPPQSIFNLNETTAVAAGLRSPEKLGIGVAEHYYRKYFL